MTVFKRILLSGVAIMVFAVFSPPAKAAPLFLAGDNQIFFNNFENLFDSTGAFKPLGSTVVVGDHFMGIFNVQNIDNNGLTHYFSGPTEQISGIFAQRVEAVVGPPDAFPAGGPFQVTFPHIVLGAPTITSFFIGADVVSTVGLLAGIEQIAFFQQSGVGTTVFESNGSMLDDVTKATDGGNKILSYAYSPGADLTYGDSPATAADDTGYWYSHAPTLTPVSGDVGSTKLGLDLVVNTTGFTFNKLNDINESEVGFGKLNDVVGTGEIEVNSSPTSPWKFASNDPLTVNIDATVPEPSSLVVFGLLAGISAAVQSRRRKRTSSVA